MIIKTGIYKIQSIIKPDRFYIGSAINLPNRKRQHFYTLKVNKHGNSRLQNHYNKYGKEDFIFSVLLECDAENLLIEEQKLLDSTKPFFNICKVAGNTLGVIRTEESKRKMSEAKKKMTDETKQKLREARLRQPNPNLGRPMSEAQKQKLREINLGKKHSEETKLKVSMARKGILKSEETKKRMSIAQQNMSEETKRKISMTKKGVPVPMERRLTMNKCKKGIPLSKEHKLKISEGLKKRAANIKNQIVYE